MRQYNPSGYKDEDKEGYAYQPPVALEHALKPPEPYAFELAKEIRPIIEVAPKEMGGAYGDVYPGYAWSPIRLRDDLGNSKAEVTIHEAMHVIHPGNSEADNRSITYTICQECGIPSDLHKKLGLNSVGYG